jgi:ribonuclease BN (tRNA processing enzyme)
MKIFFNGTGDAFSQVSYNTSFIVQSKGYNLLVECPHPLFKILAEHKIQKPEWPTIDEINSVYISHLHGDHMNGLEGYAFYKKFVKNKPVDLCIPEYYSDIYWDYRLKSAMGCGIDQDLDTVIFEEDFFFNKKVLSVNKVNRVGPFLVKIVQTKHHIPGYAIFITDGDKSISFSSDTRLNMKLINWLGTANLIIHESNYGPGHTDWNDLNSLDKDIKNKMVLVHLPDNFDAGSIAKAEDGMILEV